MDLCLCKSVYIFVCVSMCVLIYVRILVGGCVCKCGLCVCVCACMCRLSCVCVLVELCICVSKCMRVRVLRTVLLTQQGLTKVWLLITLHPGPHLPEGRDETYENLGFSGYYTAHAWSLSFPQRTLGSSPGYEDLKEWYH